MTPDPDTLLARLGRGRIIAVIRETSAAAVVETGVRLVASGVRALEVTYTSPGASVAIGALREQSGDDVVVGAGSITSPAEALAAAGAGAQFLVSPGSTPRLVEGMLATDLLVVPGVMTPSEIIAARGLGVRAVKLFPAALFGPSGLRALRAPFPGLAIIPTGGITLDAVDAWIEAGAHAVGLGTAADALTG